MDMIEVMDVVNAPGDAVNEDRVGYRLEGRVAAWVIDGATGVADREYVPESPGSDAAWLAQSVNDLLIRQDPGQAPVADYFTSVLEAVRAAYAAQVPAFGRLPPHALPSGTITWMRPGNGVIEFARQGDCSAVVQSADTTTVVGNPGIGKWETVISEGEQALLSHQAGNKARIGAVIDELRAARSNLNQPGGYPMMGIEPAAARAMTVEHIPIAGEAIVLLASDGLWRLVDAFRLYDAVGLVAAATRHGLDALLAELRRVETEDGDAVRAPRVKIHDDASGLLIRVSSR